MIFWVSIASAGTWELVQERRDTVEVQGDAQVEARAAYTRLVRDLARAAPSGQVPADSGARAAALDLELQLDGTALWLRERADAARGRGVVALRIGPLAEELVVQAPHPTSDLHTGAIAGALFDGGGVRAACFATTRRSAYDGADAAHAPASWFQSATDGLADALVDPLFVQVHGFGGNTTEADGVVSEGPRRLPREELDRAVRRISVSLGASDVRTGDEVPALAARTNAQGRLLADRARFLHVELSLAQREGLRADAARRTAFVDALLLLAMRETVLP